MDHVLFALHVNKAALSNNLTYYDHVDRTYAAERIICYDRYPDGRPTGERQRYWVVAVDRFGQEGPSGTGAWSFNR